MKQLILTLGIILLLANIALGVIVNAFETFNLFFSCGVIVYTTIILLATCIVNMKDAFKVSLLLINTICGAIGYFIGLIIEQDITNNWCLVLLILIVAFQLILLVATNIFSK
jgi:hypothetical protein